MYKNIKFKLKIFFKNFLIKNLVNNFLKLILEQKNIQGKYFYFKKFKIKRIFEKNYFILNLRKRKNIRIKLYIKKKIKKEIKNNIPVKVFPNNFFNKKKKNLFFLTIKFIMKIFRVKIGKVNEKKFYLY
jgi:hypothetical protein